VIVAVIGATALLVGVAMLVLPGPGLLVIAGALALLATEFAWAHHLLKRVRREIRQRTGFGPDPDAEDPVRRASPRPPD
jgi:drug/metabolite transporter (DMT)-like permease